MKCPQCQFDNPETSSFCADCGTKLPSPKDAEASHTKTLETPKEEITTGSTFAGRYQIIEELGKGGMGKVYRVLDKNLEEEVALKLIKHEIASDKKTLERFSNELKLARKITHKNVGRMYELMEHNAFRFITMEYDPGENLKSFIRRSGQLAVGTAIRIAKQVCEGLAEAHSLGVIHRDLKPSNIMIDKEGNARIMDFEIARSLKAKGITGAGVIIGTPEYMSPEQVEAKDIDQRSDIYSLGIILYEMTTGQLPFEADALFAVGIKQKSENPQDPRELNPQIPENLSNVILRCLEKEKENRYQNAGEVRSELERIEKGIPLTEREIPKRKPITSKEITVTFGLKKLMIPALAIIVIAIITMMVWQFILKKEPVSAPTHKPSIAILPFEDLSPQKDQGYLCDGFAESLINALTKIRELRVPARTSSFFFKGKERDIHEVGERLNVNTVLEGSVQKAETRLRITVKLINVSDESLIWSEQYNRELDDVFAIQDNITVAIVDNLKINILGEEKARLKKRYTENTEAFQDYLKGMQLINMRTEEGIYSAIEHFKKAIEEDLDYALAYANISRCFNYIGSFGFRPPNEAFPKSKEYALKALELDETLDEAHGLIADIKYFYEWDWPGAEKAFKQAIELNPGNVLAHRWYALFLTIIKGRYTEALEELRIAQQYDPLYFERNVDFGRFYMFSRQSDKAIEELNRIILLNRNYFFAYFVLGLAYLQKDQPEKALLELQKASNIERNSAVMSWLGYTYGVMGRKKEAHSIINELLTHRKKKYVRPGNLAIVYIGLGDKDRAFEWLEKGIEERDDWLIQLKSGWWFDSLYSDPKFKALLKKMNFEE